MTKILQSLRTPARAAEGAGFSLLELTVAMAVFMIVSIVSFSLFTRHERLLGQEQGIAGLNIGLRNALAQLQLDVVNAGSGQIMGPNVPAWPVGVTIINSNPTASQCFTAANINSAGVMLSAPNYAASCFDQLNVVMVDANTPPIQPTNSCSSPLNTSSGSPVTVVGSIPTVINPATGSNWTTAQVAARFLQHDQVLFVKGTISGTSYQYTTAVLTAAGATSASPAGVSLSFNPTLSGGGNSSGTPPANDPISMTINAPAAELTSSFCTTDFILRLLPIQYSVIVSNTVNGIEDPQLVRTQSGTTSVLMDQVIGFKVGAATWNDSTGTPNFDYCYNNSIATTAYCDAPTDSIYGYGSDYTLVRSVRVTIIGRTVPSADPLYTYRNPFDNGPYQIRGSTIVVDPRNLTMNND